MVTMQLPLLRQDLRLLPGGTGPGGAPTWLLWDQPRNLFFRLGWVEFELISRWTRVHEPQALIDAVNRETTLKLTLNHLETLVRFLSSQGLIHAQGRSSAQHLPPPPSLMTRLLHHYLFFRIPLVRPDSFLEAMLPLVTPSLHRLMMFLTGLAFLLGSYVTLRQWDTFTASLTQWTTPTGLAILFMTVLVAKLVHELGHAVTAKRLGCRVPVMGIAFLVLWPFFYTDTNETWRLTRKEDRLAVAAAGIMAESVLAAWGLLAWAMVDDGPWRGALFSLVAVIWTSTLLLNANPFMRFDGYFILSDALDLPNLHERAFAMGKWFIRTRLLGASLPPPEPWSSGMRVFLIAFALGTWIYRLVLYLGIALLVYHLFFKLLGAFLMGVELYWFLLRPMGHEVAWWWRNRREMAAGHVRLWMLLILLGGMVLFLPWQIPVRMPAVLRSSVYAEVYPPEGGRLAVVSVHPGQWVRQGEVLLPLEAPELEGALVQARLEVLRLQGELALLGPNFVADRLVTEQKLSAARVLVVGLLARKDRLTIRAPVSGTVTLLREGLADGLWVGKEDLLLEIRALGSERIIAYVAEKERDLLEPGMRGVFYPNHAGFPVIDCDWVDADPFAVSRLEDLPLASVYGGPLEVERMEGGGVRPLQPRFMIRFQGRDLAALPKMVAQAIPGMVILPGRPDSLAGRIGKRIAALWVREMGW
ncbi:MAG: peptidase M50 [Magnetococcales bacterium]|nr:peptidase M50 [Magnetococcales bacterium]